MKKVLGLDLGTNSIGWALVNEAESASENSSIVKLGVRAIHFDNFASSEGGGESKDPVKDFCSGKGISPNAGRTLKRSMRRNLFRYKLRRENLQKLLKERGFIDDGTILREHGNASTFETYRLRAKAVSEAISLEEFARVLLMINKKRGYRSNRKTDSSDEGHLVDGMSVALEMRDRQWTPGQWVQNHFSEGKRNVPDFYRSDLESEFNRIWDFQKQFHPQMDERLRQSLAGANTKQTWAICKEPFQLQGIPRATKGFDQKKENYDWRVEALSQKMDTERLTIVFQELNSQINQSGGYLGAIGDRSKILHFNKWTVGQYLMAELVRDPNTSLKNRVFYRKDYQDEFERLWTTQARFHPELTEELKKLICDNIIFYQRPLRSKKNLVSICELEKRKIETLKDGQKREMWIGPKVCPKSMPLFQEFKIWQVLNNVKVVDKETGEELPLSQKEKETLFGHLNLVGKMKSTEALKLLGKSPASRYSVNFKELEGNRTQERLLGAYCRILEMNGIVEKGDSKKSLETIRDAFEKMGVATDFLTWDTSLPSPNFERQKLFRLWHLLYSYEGDKSASGNASLVQKIRELCGFDEDGAKILSAVTFEEDYGNLSAKAIKKILPFMKNGDRYDEACEKAGYRHSRRSLTKEELEKKILRDKMELLPKGSLRNPVVEKILNQMVNVVNAIIDGYGKPDEIRVELARELKKSASERKAITDKINDSEKEYEEIRKILKRDFSIENPSKNDLVRYRLYKELSQNANKTLYSNQEIKKEDLFSKNIDVEHIIPQAKRFDDSFANKTLEFRNVNLKKGNRTAWDFVRDEYGEEKVRQYECRVNALEISDTKKKNLLMKGENVPEGFIERDLRNTQYIAKKAREMLEDIVKVVVPTVGSVTARLREDWGLVDVMKELNYEKYQKLGLTEVVKDKDGRSISKIKDWTKRDDHRHHAMDALTIAFTKQSHIQYLNHLNARVSGAQEFVDLANYDLSNVPEGEWRRIEAAIESKELHKDDRGKRRFNSPMGNFREEAKKHLEEILISIKPKNKVATPRKNKPRGSRKGAQNTLTPRGQLHNESIYGRIQMESENPESVNAKMTFEKIETVCDSRYREALKKRLAEFGGNPKLAFGGKNSLEKNPLYLDDLHKEKVPSKVKTYQMVYTIRKSVDKDLKVEKVVDKGIQKILQARLDAFGGDAKTAFSNLDKNPIWQNKEKGIAIKRVVIRAVNNAVALHNGHDFVSTSNNHHVAIFQDAQGNWQEHVVSFFEATERAVKGLPAIDREYKKEEGWKFLFTMKRNEYFVFPNAETGFDPSQMDLTDPENDAAISPNLFRVQKLATRLYMFRHHLESRLKDDKPLQDITWKRISSSNNLKGIVKVRINHIGQIVSVGE